MDIMKFNKILLLSTTLLLLFPFCKTNAQEKKNTTLVLDSIQFRVLYEVSQQADKNNEKITLIDTMALNIGTKWSEYYDWHKVKLDSLFKRAHDRVGPVLIINDDELNSRLEAGAEVYQLPRKAETAMIYKERATQKITTIDNGPFDMSAGPTYLIFEEQLPAMSWTISADTTTLLGYLCTRATTDFRGRTYHAWFTPEIPISEGPWKLYGLPGVILKAETIDGTYLFKAIGLEKIENESITLPNDKKVVTAKNLKQIYDYRTNARRSVEMILLKGNSARGYLTQNPIKYPQLEIDFK
ncbi:hypothetical protein HQ47_02435 [Porphyromonas macacae]|nr:hypothetical protein HQ47_02435 [Porphyromonas macacae]